VIKKIRRFSSQEDSYLAIASFLEEHTETLLSKQKNYTLALSGGRTPLGLFLFLRSEKYRKSIPWEKIQFFWSDERYVPANDPASNYLLAQENLLTHLPVKSENIFKAPTDETSCQAAAVKYQQMLLAAFSQQKTGASGSFFYPKFDLVLLGMGEDGHTASLFPNHPALKDTKLVAAVESEYARPPVPRLTFTLSLINSADTVVFMVNGRDKINLLESFVDSDEKNCLVPASMVAPRNQLIWFVWP
jgi:6-phosphogluconolactonase